MPSGKETTGTKAKKPIEEGESVRKAAVELAQKVKKDHRKLKPKAFAKKFDEEIIKVCPAARQGWGEGDLRPCFGGALMVRFFVSVSR